MDFRHVRARRKQGNIGAGEIVIIERLYVEQFGLAETYLLADRIAAGQRDDLARRKLTFSKEFKNFAAHIARGADNSDFVCHDCLSDEMI